MWVSQHLEIDVASGKLQEHEEVPAIVGDDGEVFPGEIQNVMSTPFGFWKIDDAMNPYKQFKLWMGHTNFTITPAIANEIKNVPGIEILNILTRYRFIIGIGELFDIRDVRTAIEKSLNCNMEEMSLIFDKTLRKKIENLKNKLAQKYGKYAIFIFPNGEIDHITSENNNKDFTQKLLLYRKSVDHSNGVLIESEDNE